MESQIENEKTADLQESTDDNDKANGEQGIYYRINFLTYSFINEKLCAYDHRKISLSPIIILISIKLGN